MDRIIEVKVDGNYLSKDNKNAGVRGEGNVTSLRITFDAGWDGYAKKVTFWDALGANPVERTLTTDLLENITQSTRVYLVLIPAEPMAEAGMLTFVIDGYVGGKRQRSVSDKLLVKDAPIADNAGEPIDPTPTQAEQLQVQIDKFVGDVQAAVIARDETRTLRNETRTLRNETEEFSQNAEENAKKAIEKASEAKRSATLAGEAVGKTSYIGNNGNWYAWDSVNGQFYDTGVRAQSGSIVYYGDNPPPEADVWVQPDGVGTIVVPVRAFVNILGGDSNWVAEDVYDGNNNIIGVRYGQVVNVNNAVITPSSKVDLQITSEQMVVFHEKDLAFVAENEDGVVTIYCIGSIPQNDYTVQTIVTEVLVND